MMIPAKSEDFDRIRKVFLDLFAPEFARISKVFREIPGLDTGHDGSELCIAREGYDVRCFPDFDEGGHTGRWDLTLADRREGQELRFFGLQVLFKDEGCVVLKHGTWDGAYHNRIEVRGFPTDLT